MEEAEQAIESAQQDIDAALRNGPEVKRLADELRAHREINHLAKRIRASMGGA